MTDESIFAAALAIGSPAERAAYLDRACDADPGLRREIEALLAAHAADNPLDRPLADLDGTGSFAPRGERAGATVGPYKLLQQIGEGGMGTVYMAEQTAPAVVARVQERFDCEAPSQTQELWSAAYILMGLRYEKAMVQSLLRGVVNMKQSTTYQAILEEGEAIGVAQGKAEGKAGEARKLLLLQGRNRFGEPTAKVVAELDTVTDLGRLEALVIRLLHVESREELLGASGTTRQPRGRRKA